MTLKSTKALLVLGMHRSGTSALAGTLSLLGINAGSDLLPACEGVNPKGFWEHAGVVDLHDRLLASIGSSWNDERSLPENWWLLPEVQPFRRELVKMLGADFAEVAVWMVKDPRMCRLMPLWHQVLQELECLPRVVIILRDPREVAKSLATRDGVVEERSSLLWLQHLLDSEKWTRSYPRTIVTFEGLLEDWHKTVKQIDAALGLQLLDYTVASQSQVVEFLEPSLRHHAAVDSSVGRIAALALSAYHVCAMPRKVESLERDLKEIEAQVIEWTNLVAPWSEEVQVLRYKLGLCVAELAGVNHEVVRVKSTFSWRITAPLRGLWNLIIVRAARRKGVA